jgi:hypothetical protein
LFGRAVKRFLLDLQGNRHRLFPMDSPSTEVLLQQEAAAPTVAAPCPLCEHPENLHQYIFALESRIAKLEMDRDRFQEALLKVGAFIFDSPMSKMMLSSMPKAAQEKLQSYFGGK